MSAAPLRAVCYVRISRDKEGAGLGVERQEADCRALADRLGWDVVAVFTDNDISAYSGKVRPGYRAMVEAVKDGTVGAIVAWHPDRLHRRVAELEEFINLVEAAGVEVRTVTAGDLDLSTATGRMTARIVGAVAQKEAEQTRDRVARAKTQAAAAGKFRGSKRPFGFEKDGVTVRPREAAVIREATAGVLAGRSLHALARELNERKVTTSTGRQWTHQRVRDVLVRPRNAALIATGRPDHGAGHFQIVGPAVWEAIVDEDTWRACHQFLTDTRRRHPNHATDARWLLSGIARCGLCGSPLRGNPVGPGKGSGRTPKNHYRCEAGPHLSILAAPTEAHVRAAVAALIRDPKVVAAMVPDDTGEAVAALRQRRIVLESKLSRTEDDYTADLITASQLKKVTASVSAELERIDVTVADRMRASALAPIVGAVDPGAAFLESAVDVARRVVDAAVRIEILPTPYRGAAWSPQRVRLSPVA